MVVWSIRRLGENETSRTHVLVRRPLRPSVNFSLLSNRALTRHASGKRTFGYIAVQVLKRLRIKDKSSPIRQAPSPRNSPTSYITVTILCLSLSGTFVFAALIFKIGAPVADKDALNAIVEVQNGSVSRTETGKVEVVVV